MRRAYTSRRNALEKETTWRLTTEALEEVREGTQGLRIPWASVREVNLRFHPTRYSRRRCRCRVIGERASVLIDSVSYRGFADFEDRGPEYALFVHALVGELAGREVVFSQGVSRAGYGLALALAGLTGLLLVVVGFLLMTAGLHGVVAVKVLLLLAMLPALWGYLKRNRPGRFEPGRIPPGVLP